jgi:hypothetical protein
MIKLNLHLKKILMDKFNNLKFKVLTIFLFNFVKSWIKIKLKFNKYVDLI